MKSVASLSFIALFVFAASGFGQETANDAVSSISAIHRPTPKPGTEATAVAPGPMKAVLAKDEKAKTATTSFSQHDSIFLVVQNVTAKGGDKLSASWTAVSTGGKLPAGKNLHTTSLPVAKDGIYSPSFNLPSTKEGFPPGKYEVTFSLNGKETQKLSFSVK